MQRGFTLVEIAIVLVIIGLLVGGVLVGKDLIRAAELRSIGNDFHRYDTAVAAFRLKFSGLPGDITNATYYWGAAVSCPGSNATPSTDGSTCNGNGNGIIGDSVPETFRFWQQLGNAGFIEGTYTGVPGSAGSGQSVIGDNVPRSRFLDGGYSIYYANAAFAAAAFLNTNASGLVMFMGKAGNGATVGAIMLPPNAYDIDTKLDDGLPGTGRIQQTVNTQCYTGTDPLTATYTLAQKTVSACAINYYPKF